MARDVEFEKCVVVIYCRPRNRKVWVLKVCP